MDGDKLKTKWRKEKKHIGESEATKPAPACSTSLHCILPQSYTKKHVRVCMFTAAAAASKPATEVAPSNRFASRAKDTVLPAATSMDTKSLPRFKIPEGSTAWGRTCGHHQRTGTPTQVCKYAKETELKKDML
jgi:hypothetical protein